MNHGHIICQIRHVQTQNTFGVSFHVQTQNTLQTQNTFGVSFDCT